MEDSVAEEAEASNHKNKKKNLTIQIVKLEFIEDEPEETKNINPIPG